MAPVLKSHLNYLLNVRIDSTVCSGCYLTDSLSLLEIMVAGNMDKLKLTGGILGRVFNSRHGRACIGHTIVHITKQPNLS